MEKNSLKTTFILPPNVNGRCRGTLSLCLHEIKWQNEEPFQFNSILAKVHWWGDSSGVTLKLKNKKHLRKSFGHVIRYNILTKPTLFRNYLISAERIEIKFTSEISNIDIGKATVPIPIELIGLIDQKLPHSAKSLKIRKKCHIFNGQNRNMGELLIDYDLQLYDRISNQHEIGNGVRLQKFCCSEQQKISTENDMNQFNLELDLDFIKHSTKKTHKKKSKSKSSHGTKGKLLEKVPTSDTKRLLSISTIPSPLLNYLTGRPLGKAEESAAIKAMESTSPTESLMDMLSFDLNGLYLPKKTDNAESKALQKIDCLRIHVYDMCLTRAGTREILSKNALNETSFSSGTFSIGVDLDSILCLKSPFEKNVTLASKVTRIFSSSIETLPPSIEFNRATVYKLNTFCIKSRNSYANGIISLTVNYCDIESSESRVLGTARIHLDDIIKATNLTFQQQCPVTTLANGIIIGRILVKVELGCRGLHFGADFLEAISSNAIDGNTVWNDYCSHFSNDNPDYFNRQCEVDEEKSYFESSRKYDGYEHEHRLDYGHYHSCVYDVHDEQTENKSNTPSTPMNIESQSSNAQKLNGANSDNVADEPTNKDFIHGSSNVDELNDDAENELKGLFYVGQINCCSWYQSIEETFLVCRPFWVDAALVTDNCLDKTKDETYQLNYLEQFSVLCDQKLFESTKHGFMSVEVWRRDNNHANSMIGSAKVPLHQFFIAFNNNNIRNHVRKQELPVISIDGWVTIPYSASPNSTPVGTVQTILAVGTAKQINNLKKSKNLLSYKSFSRLPLDMYPLPTNNVCAIPSQSKENRHPVNLKSALPQFNDRNSNLAAMFSSFIDTLASRLPERNQTVTETTASNDATTQTNHSANNSPAVNNKNGSGPCMRPTSELLDELQKALAIAPTLAQRSAIPTAMQIPSLKLDQNVTLDLKSVSMFRVYIEIESALHLPSIVVHVNKKSGKRNRNSIGSGKKGGSTEIQPSTYATFEAAASPTSNLTSYATNIMESSCSPQWNKHFEVFLPVEFLQNDEKRFVVRVWRKINDNTPKTRLIPSSSNDVTVGFASVDLSVLMAGLPAISGWFNIIDHSGCINGQIKVHIKPKDDLTIYQKRPPPELVPNDIKTVDEVQETEQNAIDVTSNESRAIDDSALSRALKRKFTELEEITQRLRARLFDVTADMSMDPDEEFENDLNTIPDEDDDFEESNIASEMSLDWLEHCQNQASSNEGSSHAAHMQDIFELLSPDFGTNQSTSRNQSQDIAKTTSVDQLNQQPQNANNDSANDMENTVQNIADSLQKSLIKD